MTRPATQTSSLKYVWHSNLADGVKSISPCRMSVIGIGRSGSNTVTRLAEIRTVGTEYIALDTDAVHLAASRADQKILIGERTTRGHGTRGDKQLGFAAIEKSRKRIEELLANVGVVFVVAGLGGGTGAGVAPVVAEIAKLKGAVTVGIVTLPFGDESSSHVSSAIAQMRGQCDTIVIVDNNRLVSLVPELPIDEAMKAADQMLANMIRSIVETMSSPSLINMNIADFRTVVKRGGIAVVGIGESNAPNRAEEAVRNALRSPLLDIDCAGATGALVQVTGDSQMTVEEANRVGETVAELMHNNALVTWGARVNPEQEGKLRVMLVMTGINSSQRSGNLSSVAPQLYSMEQKDHSEVQLDIELNLYQMENDAKHVLLPS